MLDQITKANELCEPKEKPHHLNKNQIISYLSFLEKLYEKENKNSDKFSQKRKFLINKALNSVRKYSNFKVSPFSLNKSSLKEERKEKDKCDIVEEEKKEQNDIEEIMCLIEKELKLNGIDTNEINDNSFMSTNIKSQNSDSNPDTKNKNPDSNNPDSQSPNPENNNKEKNQKRLSKLFLKIEMQLKTFLQKEQEKDSKNQAQLQDNNKGLNNNLIISNNNNLKLSKRPYKMPNLANSFFSDKKKVETMLSRAKKHKRKSMTELNTLFLLKKEKEKDVCYIEDSNDNNKKKKISTALLQRPEKKKMVRNTDNKLISNFNCGKIDQIIENKAEYDEIIPFDKIDEKLSEANPDPNKDDMIDETPLFFDNTNNSSIKIASTINKNKFNPEEFNKEMQKQISLYQKDETQYFFQKDDNWSFLDNGLLIQSSEKEDSSDSKIEEEEDEEDSCCSDDCEKLKNNEVNSSEDEKEENGKKDSKKGSDDSNKKTSNFNYFYKNSIFSPLRDLPNNPRND